MKKKPFSLKFSLFLTMVLLFGICILTANVSFAGKGDKQKGSAPKPAASPKPTAAPAGPGPAQIRTETVTIDKDVENVTASAAQLLSDLEALESVSLENANNLNTDAEGLPILVEKIETDAKAALAAKIPAAAAKNAAAVAAFKKISDKVTKVKTDGGKLEALATTIKADCTQALRLINANNKSPTKAEKDAAKAKFATIKTNVTKLFAAALKLRTEADELDDLVRNFNLAVANASEVAALKAEIIEAGKTIVVNLANEEESPGKALGHTIREHVKKDVNFLMARLGNEPKLNLASTWNDQATAEKWISKCLSDDYEAIQEWLDTKVERKEVNGTADVPIGWSINRTGKTNYTDGLGEATTPEKKKALLDACTRDHYNYTIVLVQKEGTPRGYFILTAYPNF